MLVTPPGMVTSLRPEQPEKADPLMVVMFFGSVMEVRPVHSLKALPSMLVTLSGMLMAVMLL